MGCFCRDTKILRLATPEEIKQAEDSFKAHAHVCGDPSNACDMDCLLKGDAQRDSPLTILPRETVSFKEPPTNRLFPDWTDGDVKAELVRRGLFNVNTVQMCEISYARYLLDSDMKNKAVKEAEKSIVIYEGVPPMIPAREWGSLSNLGR